MAQSHYKHVYQGLIFAALACFPWQWASAQSSVSVGSLGPNNMLCTFGADCEESDLADQQCGVELTSPLTKWYAFTITSSPPATREPGLNYFIVSPSTPQTGCVEVTTEGSNYDTVVSILTGTDILDMKEISCNDNCGVAGKHSRVFFKATKDVKYAAAVGQASSASGVTKLLIRSVDGCNCSASNITSPVTPDTVNTCTLNVPRFPGCDKDNIVIGDMVFAGCDVKRNPPMGNDPSLFHLNDIIRNPSMISIPQGWRIPSLEDWEKAASLTGSQLMKPGYPMSGTFRDYWERARSNVNCSLASSLSLQRHQGVAARYNGTADGKTTDYLTIYAMVGGGGGYYIRSGSAGTYWVLNYGTMSDNMSGPPAQELIDPGCAIMSSYSGYVLPLVYRFRLMYDCSNTGTCGGTSPETRGITSTNTCPNATANVKPGAAWHLISSASQCEEGKCQYHCGEGWQLAGIDQCRR